MKARLVLVTLATPLCASNSHQILIDEDLSPYAMGQNFLTANDLLMKIEDWLIPPRNPPRSDLMSIGGRIVEMGVWSGIGQIINTTQHEVFGHGYRIRDLGSSKAHVEGYELFQFGLQGGVTKAKINPSEITIAEENAITVGGIESQLILAKQLKKHWLQRGAIEPRARTLYLYAQQSFLLYALTIEKGEVESSANFWNGNDVRAFIARTNLLYPSDTLTFRKAKRYAFLNVLDPMTWYTYIGAFKYIGTGEVISPYLIEIGPVKYLPNIKAAPAPYGIETYLENYLLYNDHPIYFYVKGGSQAGNSFGGLGIEYDYLFSGKYGSLGFRGDIWFQPDVFNDAAIRERVKLIRDSSGKIQKIQRLPGFPQTYPTSIGAFGSLVLQTTTKKDWFGFHTELGWKTRGYLPGQSLSAATVARVGAWMKW